MGYLSGQQLLEAKDVVIEEVDVPEWGGVIRIKVMSAAELDSYEKSLVEIKSFKEQKPNITNRRAKLLVRCICDEEGRRLFNDAQTDDLGRKNGLILERLHKVAQRLNKIDDESVEELKKNYAATLTSDSATDLPPSSE